MFADEGHADRRRIKPARISGDFNARRIKSAQICGYSISVNPREIKNGFTQMFADEGERR